MANETREVTEIVNRCSPHSSPFTIDTPPAHGNPEDHPSGFRRARSASSSSGLSSLHSRDQEELAPNGVSPLKIRIPKPLNIAVAAASAARSNQPLPRRSLRRSTSSYRSTSFRTEDLKEDGAVLGEGASKIGSSMGLHTV
jgi:hypothetical protein